MKSISNNKYWILNYFFLTILVLPILFIFGQAFNENTTRKSTIILLTMAILLSIFIFFVFKKLLFSYRLDILNKGILLTARNQQKLIKWQDIVDIDYYGKKDFSGLPSIKMQVKYIKRPIFLNHYHYANSNFLTQAIKYCYDSTIQNKTFNVESFTPTSIDNVSSRQIRFEKFESLKRTPLTTFRSYFPIIGMFGLCKVLTMDNFHRDGIVGTFIVFGLFFIIGFIAIGKIGISDNYLTIENYYLPIQDSFKLTDIQKVFLENQGGKNPNQIRIITKDYTQKTFRLANFINKDWLYLEKKLTDKNINVDNRLKTK